MKTTDWIIITLVTGGLFVIGTCFISCGEKSRHKACEDCSSKSLCWWHKLLFGLFWEFLCIRAFLEKIFPNWKEGGPRFMQRARAMCPPWSGEKPATFLFWAVALYTAFWGLVSQRYENNLDRLENRYNAVLVQLSTSKYKEGLSTLPKIQKTLVPSKPNFLKPLSLIESLTKETYDKEIVSETKRLIETWKEDLQQVDISGMDLSNCTLFNANMSHAYLGKTCLSGSIIVNSDFSGAHMKAANISSSIIIESNFRGASLALSNFGKSIIIDSNFKSVTLN